MKKYYTADRATGTLIEGFDTYAEARAEIERYEANDKEDGCYEADFYDIVNEEHETIELSAKFLREQTGKTQKAFAEWLGIPLRTVENWESGKNNPPSYVLELIDYRINKNDRDLSQYIDKAVDYLTLTYAELAADRQKMMRNYIGSHINDYVESTFEELSGEEKEYVMQETENQMLDWFDEDQND